MLTPNLNKNTLKQILFHKLMKNTLFCCVFLASALSSTAQVLISGFSQYENLADVDGYGIVWHTPHEPFYVYPVIVINSDGTQTSWFPNFGSRYIVWSKFSDSVDAFDQGRYNAFLLRAKIHTPLYTYNGLFNIEIISDGVYTNFKVPIRSFVSGQFADVIIPFSSMCSPWSYEEDRFSAINSFAIDVPGGATVTWDTFAAIYSPVTPVPEPLGGSLLVSGGLIAAFIWLRIIKPECARSRNSVVNCSAH